jgi:hypothetical protein
MKFWCEDIGRRIKMHAVLIKKSGKSDQNLSIISVKMITNFPVIIVIKFMVFLSTYSLHLNSHISYFLPSASTYTWLA